MTGLCLAQLQIMSFQMNTVAKDKNWDQKDLILCRMVTSDTTTIPIASFYAVATRAYLAFGGVLDDNQKNNR